VSKATSHALSDCPTVECNEFGLINVDHDVVNAEPIHELPQLFKQPWIAIGKGSAATPKQHAVLKPALEGLP